MTELEALRENVIATYLALGLATKGASIEDTSDYIICRSGFNHPIANFAIKINASEKGLERLIKIANESPHFRIHQMNGDTAEGLDLKLTQSGLTRFHELTGMILRNPPQKTQKLAQLVPKNKIEEVTSFMVEHFFWGSPKSLKAELASIVASVDTLKQRFYAAKEGENLVTAGTLVLTDNAVGVYNVCVRTDRRRHGIGSAFVRQLSAIAVKEGKNVVLQCDPSLVSWYRKLGYEAIGRLATWGKKEKPSNF